MKYCNSEVAVGFSNVIEQHEQGEMEIKNIFFYIFQTSPYSFELNSIDVVLSQFLKSKNL